jgi:hypothetical protein
MTPPLIALKNNRQKTLWAQNCKIPNFCAAGINSLFWLLWFAEVSPVLQDFCDYRERGFTGAT